MMRQHVGGYLCALFAIFFWSFNVIYAKYLANTFTPFEISFIRWVIPGILFLPFAYHTIILLRGKFLKNWLLIMILALTGLGFQNTFIYYAGRTTDAVDMALIGATSPIFLAIFSALMLHSRITWRQVIGIVVTVFGVAIVILKGDFTNLKGFQFNEGFWWMLASAVIFAVYGVAQKMLPSDIPQFPVFSLMICISSLIFLPLAGYDFVHHEPQNITKIDVLILVILGVFNSGIAYLAWDKALTTIGPVRTGTIYYIEPVLSTIEAYLFLNEQIYSAQIYGIVLVLVGIAISNYSKNNVRYSNKQE